MESVNKIENLLNEKRFAEAFEMIDNILKNNENKKDEVVEILEAVGENFIDEEDNESAEKIFKKESTIKPLNGYFNLGMLYLNMERNDDAISSFKKSIEHGNKSADVYRFVGMAYLNKGDCDNALSYLTKSVSIEENFDNFYYLGLAYLGKEEYENAIKFFSKANEIKENYETLYYLGMAYLGKEEYKMAIDFFTKSINRNADFADSYYYRGMAYYAIGNEREATKNYERACELKEEYVDLPYESYR